MFKRLKTAMPRGLYGRALLILIVPIVTIQLVVSTAFIQRHFEDVTRQMTRGVLRELQAVTAAAAGADTSDGAIAAAAPLAEALGHRIAAADGPPRVGDARAFYDLSGRVVIEILRGGLPELRSVDLLSASREVRLALDLPTGPVDVVVDRRRVSASNPHQLLVLMIVTSVLMTLIAYLFLRNQLRPIKRLADAAEAFGKGRTVPYRPGGALEVRAAGNAFLDMRSRIERQIEQRTAMLSGVSHDLRTPLTRLRLGLSMMPEDAETAALIDDVAEMERLVEEFLSFARGDAMEDPVQCDPVVLVAKAVENAQRSGRTVALVATEGQGMALIRPDAVTRAVNNLIGNAVRYGTRAEVSVAILERSVRITVEDDGPGIPKDQRDDALRPFVRLDRSRNQNAGGGVGLGLSITADIARTHGGTLRLGASDRLGGLRAELVLAR